MINPTYLGLALVPCLLSPAIAAQPDTHYTLAQEVIALLSETEQILNSCSDADSTAAALPELRKLAQRAAELRTRQLQLADSTMQEDINIAPLVQDFQLIWGAVCAQIERLEQAGLLSEALREVLCISPTTN